MKTEKEKRQAIEKELGIIKAAQGEKAAGKGQSEAPYGYIEYEDPTTGKIEKRPRTENDPPTIGMINNFMRNVTEGINERIDGVSHTARKSFEDIKLGAVERELVKVDPDYLQQKKEAQKYLEEDPDLKTYVEELMPVDKRIEFYKRYGSTSPTAEALAEAKKQGAEEAMRNTANRLKGGAGGERTGAGAGGRGGGAPSGIESLDLENIKTSDYQKMSESERREIRRRISNMSGALSMEIDE